MFCQNCGSEISENEKFCKNCGASLAQANQEDKEHSANENNKNQNTPTSKKGLGIVLGLFLGVLGLIIGVLIFNNDYERSTFVKGWLISLAVSGVLIIVYLASIFGLINSFIH